MHHEGCFEDGNLLTARSKGRALVPVEGGCQVFLSYFTITHLVEKASIGQISLTLIYIEPSEKAANGIYVQYMADYTNARKKVAQGEMEAFLPRSSGTASPRILTAFA